MGHRVAAFAFDSPDPDLLGAELEAGRMPNLAAMIERGRLVQLTDGQEILTPASSPTIAHGCSPAVHQLVYPTQLVPGTYTLTPVDGNASAQPPFWRHLGDAGLRSVICSPYGAGFQEGLPGAQVIGWGSHDAYARGRPLSDPPGLAAELERRFGPRTLRYEEPPPRTPAQQRDYIERMVRGTGQQGDALVWLIENQEWDFLFGFFADCHQAGHYLWHLACPGGDDPEEPAPDLRDGLSSIYRAVDDALGAVLAALPGDTTALVVNPSAMGVHHGLGEAVEPVLDRAGWLARSTGAPAAPRQRALAAARRVVQRLVPRSLRPALARLVPRDRLVAELALADIELGAHARLRAPERRQRHDPAQRRGARAGGGGAPGRRLRARLRRAEGAVPLPAHSRRGAGGCRGENDRGGARRAPGGPAARRVRALGAAA